jgi:acyl dehydratase
MKHYAHLQDLAALVGTEIGLSDWVAVEQPRIDLFAEATGDHQWIHLDAERAAQGPIRHHGGAWLSHAEPAARAEQDGLCRGRRAHGHQLRPEQGALPGAGEKRARLRGRFRLTGFDPLPGGAQLTVEVTMEVEGGDKPVCVAESLSRRYTQSA